MAKNKETAPVADKKPVVETTAVALRTPDSELAELLQNAEFDTEVAVNLLVLEVGQKVKCVPIGMTTIEGMTNKEERNDAVELKVLNEDGTISEKVCPATVVVTKLREYAISYQSGGPSIICSIECTGTRVSDKKLTYKEYIVLTNEGSKAAYKAALNA